MGNKQTTLNEKKLLELLPEDLEGKTKILNDRKWSVLPSLMLF